MPSSPYRLPLCEFSRWSFFLGRSRPTVILLIHGCAKQRFKSAIAFWYKLLASLHRDFFRDSLNGGKIIVLLVDESFEKSLKLNVLRAFKPLGSAT